MKYFLPVLLIMLTFCKVNAQCDRLIELSKEALEARNYQLAIERLLDTRDNCPGDKEVVNGLIKEAFRKIEEEKNTVDRVLDQMYFYEGKFGLTLKKVTNKNFYGFIDRKGNEVIPFEFEEASPFSNIDGFARVTKDNQKYLLDTTGATYLLAESLNELTQETEALDLHENFPDSFDEEIWGFKNLEIFLAYAGRWETGIKTLEKLPASFTELNQLKYIDVSYRALTMLPLDLSKLSQLEHLILNGNKLTQLPMKITELRQLKNLSLSDNQISQLPEGITYFKHLLRLNLSGNQLTQLPMDIGKLSQLKYLDLGDNRLTSLPENFIQLTNLDYLDISMNQIRDLPQDFGNLMNLQNLYLWANQFSTLPERFDRLIHVRSLYLSDNNFTEIPMCLQNMVQIQYLYLDKNPIPKDQIYSLQKTLPNCIIHH